MTEEDARRALAKRLYETQVRRERAHTWAQTLPEIKREYERDVETFFDPRDERFVETMQALGWHHDNRP